MTPVIDIRDFSYRINDTPILESISLAIREGEYLSVIGPNGAGKSTLLSCILRIRKGSSGVISVAGKPVEHHSQKELARLVSYVPQSDGRTFPFTVEEYLLMGRYPHLSPFTTYSKRDREAVEDAMKLTGIAGLARRSLDTLSGGERQTAALAAALVQGGNVMLLDEPTTFLDPKHESDIHSLIRTINRERGITIVSVTHNINAAALFSDRIAVLKRGSLAFLGAPAEVMTNDILEDVYERRFRFIPHPDSGINIIIPEAEQ